MSSQPAAGMTWRLACLTLVVGIGGSLQFGLHISIINSPSKHIQKFMNQTWVDRYDSHFSQETVKLLWSLTVSIYSIGGLLGAQLTGPLCGKYGRKRTLLYNNLVAVLAAVLMVISRTVGSFEVILLGRMLYGVNAGLGLLSHIMYIAECAPRKLWGMITVSASLFIAVGKLIGLAFGMSEYLASEAAWPFLMASSGIPALLQLVTLPFFPESPRYLLIDMDDKEGCLKAMNQLWKGRDHMAEMTSMMDEREVINGVKSKSVVDLLKDHSVRRQLIILLLVCGGLQFIGINVVYFYAYDVFQNTGIASGQIRYMALGMAITEIFTTILCGCVIEYFGRRTLLVGGYASITVILGLLTATLTLKDMYSWMPYSSTVLIFLFILSFGLGPGSVSCPLPTELFLQTYRPASLTLYGFVNWLGMFIIGLGFPFLVEWLGTYCFLIFLMYSLLMTVFVWGCLPETKGRTMLEIMEAFNHLNFQKCKKKEDLENNDFAILATKL
ncbi:solute carrier family 2, facilitated glucose transporter member 11-like [Lissotriton helveticus]